MHRYNRMLSVSRCQHLFILLVHILFWQLSVSFMFSFGGVLCVHFEQCMFIVRKWICAKCWVDMWWGDIHSGGREHWGFGAQNALHKWNLFGTYFICKGNVIHKIGFELDRKRKFIFNKSRPVSDNSLNKKSYLGNQQQLHFDLLHKQPNQHHWGVYQ